MSQREANIKKKFLFRERKRDHRERARILASKIVSEVLRSGKGIHSDLGGGSGVQREFVVSFPARGKGSTTRVGDD